MWLDSIGGRCDARRQPPSAILPALHVAGECVRGRVGRDRAHRPAPPGCRPSYRSGQESRCPGARARASSRDTRASAPSDRAPRPHRCEIRFGRTVAAVIWNRLLWWHEMQPAVFRNTVSPCWRSGRLASMAARAVRGAEGFFSAGLGSVTSATPAAAAPLLLACRRDARPSAWPARPGCRGRAAPPRRRRGAPSDAAAARSAAAVGSAPRRAAAACRPSSRIAPRTEGRVARLGRAGNLSSRSAQSAQPERIARSPGSVAVLAPAVDQQPDGRRVAGVCRRPRAAAGLRPWRRDRGAASRRRCRRRARRRAAAASARPPSARWRRRRDRAAAG